MSRRQLCLQQRMTVKQTSESMMCYNLYIIRFGYFNQLPYQKQAESPQLPNDQEAQSIMVAMMVQKKLLHLSKRPSVELSSHSDNIPQYIQSVAVLPAVGTSYSPAISNHHQNTVPKGAFQHQWLPWLVYSEQENSGFCLLCPNWIPWIQSLCTSEPSGDNI